MVLLGVSFAYINGGTRGSSGMGTLRKLRRTGINQNTVSSISSQYALMRDHLGMETTQAAFRSTRGLVTKKTNTLIKNLLISRTAGGASSNMLIRGSRSMTALQMSTNANPDTTAVEEDTTFKGLFKKYGFLFVCTYAGVYVSTLGAIFGSLEYDLFHASSIGFEPAQAIIKICNTVEYYTGYSSLPQFFKANPTWGTFALAWSITKFTEPLRLIFTLGVTPKLSVLLGRTPNAVVDETTSTSVEEKKTTP